MYPGIASLENGRVFLAWSDERRAGFPHADIFANISEDFGDTWSAEDTRVDVGFDLGDSRGTQVVRNDVGQIFVFWFDTNDEDFSGASVVASAYPALSIGAGVGEAIIPPEGGPARAEFRLWNNDAQTTLTDLPVWVDVTTPDGAVTRPILGPVTLSRLRPGRRILRKKTFSVPAGLAPGTYVLNLHAAGPIQDFGSFCIIKRP